MSDRPASLDDLTARLQTLVEESGESPEEWAAALGFPPPRRGYNAFRRILSGRGGLTAWRLVLLDDLCARAFLTPPEREWAETAAARTRRKYRKMTGEPHLSEGFAA